MKNNNIKFLINLHNLTGGGVSNLVHNGYLNSINYKLILNYRVLNYSSLMSIFYYDDS